MKLFSKAKSTKEKIVLSDEELAVMAQKNNLEALEIIFKRYESKIYNLSYRILGNKEDAKDVTQETLIRFYKSIRSFDPKLRLRPWIYKIASNLCLTFLSSKKYTLSLTKNDGSQYEIEDQKQNLWDKTNSISDEEVIQRSLLLLPGEYRLVLLLFYWYDLPYREIAEITNTPINTVRTHLKRSKERLRKILRQQNYGS